MTLVGIKTFAHGIHWTISSGFACGTLLTVRLAGCFRFLQPMVSFSHASQLYNIGGNSFKPNWMFAVVLVIDWGRCAGELQRKLILTLLIMEKPQWSIGNSNYRHKSKLSVVRMKAENKISSSLCMNNWYVTPKISLNWTRCTIYRFGCLLFICRTTFICCYSSW